MCSGMVEFVKKFTISRLLEGYLLESVEVSLFKVRCFSEFFWSLDVLKMLRYRFDSKCV